jgi:hypothetical protein
MSDTTANLILYHLRKIVFGDGIIVLPGRNFARFLLINFILFCFILRTAYQGKLFEFMQRDMRPKSVETVNELIDQKFKIFAHIMDANFYSEMGFEK